MEEEEERKHPSYARGKRRNDIYWGNFMHDEK
jgi:hypothetical protein